MIRIALALVGVSFESAFHLSSTFKINLKHRRSRPQHSKNLMAEPISIASGLITLIGVALNSSVALFEIVQSLKHQPSYVRELREELDDLRMVLQSLDETVKLVRSGNWDALSLPVKRCGKICEDFQQEILNCSSHTTNDRTSFRDWARLKYMGGGIREFRESLTRYKSTIAIALNDASL